MKENIPILEIRGVSKTYKSNGANIAALKDVSLSLDKGKILGIIGESGSGKTTLAKLITGLEKSDCGEILYCGKDIRKLLVQTPKAYRKSVQTIFQNPFESFNPIHTIGKSIMDIIKIYENNTDVKKRAHDMLEQYGLSPANSFISRYPHELSGGQLQRIAILRAMIPKPKLLIADEAVSMLDASIRADILSMLSDIVMKSGTSLIFISHDIATTAYISDDICVLYNSNIVEYKNADELIKNPSAEYTKHLIEIANKSIL